MELYRKKLVAGNWKMNTDLREGEKLASDVLNGLASEPACEVVLAPPFTHLYRLNEILQGKSIQLAAQNCHFEKSGAFTGEVSPAMLKNLGVEYVIVGHSERRQLFHETNSIVKFKLDAVLEGGLKPIFCCGEPLDIRQGETHNVFVRMQLEESLFHLEQDAIRQVCIAYEPIWAIGTGVTATPEQAQEMHVYIREQLAEKYSKVISEEVRILYGGSIKADNAKSLFTQDDVDGGLVGGSSLSASAFIEIINAAC
jgi:triosephosphate isomerase